MKHTLNYFGAALLSLFIFTACSSESTDSEESQVETTEPTLQLEGLELDEGEKWLANQETTDGINRMISIIEKDESINIEEYQSLAEKLATEKTEIFKQCTMKGEAHNNLHAYLMPLIDFIKELEACVDEPDAERIVESIQLHLNGYDEYFKN